MYRLTLKLTVEFEDHMLKEYVHAFDLPKHAGEPDATEVANHVQFWAETDIDRATLGDYATIKVRKTGNLKQVKQ